MTTKANGSTQLKQNNHFQTLEAVKSDLRRKKDAGYTYGEIGLKQGISGGLAWSILNKGYEPKSPQIRKQLNLHPLSVEVSPCPYCGDKAHTYNCQEQVVKPAPKAPRPKRKRTPYKNIDPTNPEQVRRQIAKYMPGYELVEKER